MTFHYPSALTIAGSDPSGGAGIQVDLKTFAAAGVWGMAVITSLTAQNAGRVSDVWTMDPDVVSRQISTLLEEHCPGAVKTGMLATSGIIREVARVLPDDLPLVIDPVMVSTSGHRLLDSTAVDDLKNILLPRSSLVTPNIPEAEVLCGFSIHGEDDMEIAGNMILETGVNAVLIKGGHGTGDLSEDLLITPDEVIRFSSPRHPYPVHGSGCCFSAAITGYMALGYSLDDACKRGKSFVSDAIRSALPGEGEIRMVNPGGVRQG